MPARLVPYVEWHYPPELRAPIRGETPPPADTVPPGTRFVRKNGHEKVVLVRDEKGDWVVQPG